MVAATNDINDLRPLMDAVNATILTIKPTEVSYVGN